MGLALWVAVDVTVAIYVCLELFLVLRDRVRHTGSTGQDRSTRRISWLAWAVAMAAATAVFAALRHDAAWNMRQWHLVAGLLVMWAGLALRIWSIHVLGRVFRTTVEVDAAQQLVDRGPYRCVRHPSYTGLLVLGLGIGLAIGNWLSLAIMVLLPLAAQLPRIFAEEALLAEVLGQPYIAYQARTKRLIPGIW